MLDAVGRPSPSCCRSTPAAVPRWRRSACRIRGLRVVDPLGYVDFLSLVRGATAVITDSGGIQEETTMLGVPCLTVRPNTERPVTITQGTNRLIEPEDVAAAVQEVLAEGPQRSFRTPPLWDGRAGPRIAAIIAEAVAD